MRVPAAYALAERNRGEVLAEALDVLARRITLIAVCAGAGLLAGLLYFLVRSPRYEATALIEVRPTSYNSLGLDEREAKAPNPGDSTTRLQAALQVLRSKTLALDVIEELGMAQNPAFAGRWRQADGVARDNWPPAVRDQLLARFQKALTTDLITKSDVITISFRAKSPELAADAVNAVVRRYRQRTVKASYDSANEVSEWLSQQLEDLKNQAGRSQEVLANWEKHSGLLGRDETDNIVFEKLQQLDQSLTELESDRIVKEARYRIANSSDPELLATSAPDPTLQLLHAQQASLRLQYAELNSKYGSAYPKLAEVSAQISAVDAALDRRLKQMAQRYRNDYEAAQRSENSLRARFDQQARRAYRLNEEAAQHAILKREVESNQQLYDSLQLKLKQAGIAAGLASSNIEVIDPAQAPSEPAEPKPLRTGLLGLGAGLACGVALALLQESADDAIRSVEDAEQASELPSLGTVPRLEDHTLGLLRGCGTDRAVVLHKPASRAAECYRSLSNSLLLSCRDQKPGVIVVTSAVPLEGKTTTAVNLATALAQQGSRVLLVDADVRQPSVHQYLNVPRQPGLLESIAHSAASNGCNWHDSQQAGLCVLPAGASAGDGAPAIEPKTIAALLQQWRSQFDHVVVDSPPVTLISDAMLLAAHSDAVLLVVRRQTTSRRNLRQTCDTLQRASAHLAGFVLNAAEPALWYRYDYFKPRQPAADAYYDKRPNA
jgi:capsular exopolysaccharide synthesis family protein